MTYWEDEVCWTVVPLDGKVRVERATEEGVAQALYALRAEGLTATWAWVEGDLAEPFPAAITDALWKTVLA